MNIHNECGNWPANAIADITDMRNKLRDDAARGQLFKSTFRDFVFVAHNRIIRRLECMVTRSGESYRDYLIKNCILHSIIIDDSCDDNEGYLYATNHGMPLTIDVEGARIIPKDTFIKFISLQSKLENEQDE